MEFDQEYNKIGREIYEAAIKRMEEEGTRVILKTKLFEKRDRIKKSLLDYYESTEEYEKCKYIIEYFGNLEKEITISGLIGSISEKND